MLFTLLVLLIGIVVLVKFSNITIDRAVKLSYLSGLSQIAIGFVFIAVITSLPELAIGIISAFEGVPLLSVGNLIGANITNLTLVFGLTALIGFNLGNIFTPRIERAVFLTSLVAIFLIVIGGADFTFGIFCILVFYLFVSQMMKGGFTHHPYMNTIKIWSIIVAAVHLVLAVIVVIISAYFITESAVELASTFGISASIVGASILALGTTLPELSINIAAIKKRNISLAIGDVTGSIVTNLTLILGVVAIINPFIIGATIYTALIMLVAVCAIFFILAKHMNFGSKQGIFLLSLYIIYLMILFSGITIW